MNVGVTYRVAYNVGSTVGQGVEVGFAGDMTVAVGENCSVSVTLEVLRGVIGGKVTVGVKISLSGTFSN